MATTLLILFEGAMPISALIFAPDSVLGSTVSLGFPTYFGYTLIAFRVIGCLILGIPRLPRSLKEWTYAGFAFEFIFASISHLIVDKNPIFILLPLIAFGVLIISYINHFKVYHREEVMSEMGLTDHNGANDVKVKID